jgi:murein L,D-transpeptidase YafK
MNQNKTGLKADLEGLKIRKQNLETRKKELEEDLQKLRKNKKITLTTEQQIILKNKLEEIMEILSIDDNEKLILYKERELLNIAHILEQTERAILEVNNKIK